MYNDIYSDISKRTGGDIYIGVVGPVRTGKSTFIKRFMDLMVIPEIKDVHGRLSDMIADIEDKVGIAVIPFEMVGIANEVVRLQRYEIFTISGKKYAMSKVPRERVMSQFLDRIVKTLSNGLPFNESLVTSVDFEGKVYKTLTLSQVEWNTILSKLRSYKQRLYICNHSDVIMEVLAERV